MAPQAPAGSLCHVWPAAAAEWQGRLQALLRAARMGRIRSIGILLRADRIAVAILIATVTVVAIGSGCRGTDRCRPVDASADSGACYRAAIIPASGNCVSTTGNAVTAAADAYRSATDAYGASVKASTSAVTAAAPTCERIIRHEAGSD